MSSESAFNWRQVGRGRQVVEKPKRGGVVTPITEKQKAEYMQLLKLGVISKEACRRVGISEPSGSRIKRLLGRDIPGVLTEGRSTARTMTKLGRDEANRLRESGSTNQEIADQIGVSIGAIQRHFLRAKKGKK